VDREVRVQQAWRARPRSVYVGAVASSTASGWPLARAHKPVATLGLGQTVGTICRNRYAASSSCRIAFPNALFRWLVTPHLAALTQPINYPDASPTTFGTHPKRANMQLSLHGRIGPDRFPKTAPVELRTYASAAPRLGRRKASCGQKSPHQRRLVREAAAFVRRAVAIRPTLFLREVIGESRLC
jgi:hypothetical protein